MPLGRHNNMAPRWGGYDGFVFQYTQNFFLIVTSLSLWYIWAIVQYYSVAPLINNYTSKVGFVISLAIISYFLLFLLGKLNLGNYVCANMECSALRRFPIFLCGMYMYNSGKSFSSKKVITCTLIFGGLVLLLKPILYMRDYNEDVLYILVIPAIPGACLALTKLKSYVSKYGESFFAFFGRYSLEIYLWHQYVIKNMTKVFDVSNAYLLILISFVLSCILAYLTKIIVENGKRIFTK